MKGRKQFFFEKKNQKAFICFGTWPPGWHAKRSKSFLVLFFKKELLPAFL
jgi:hypothetical protein